MKGLFGNVYQNKRVLVTGHTGFKGSWLCTWLYELGANVIGYALIPKTSPSMFEVCQLQDKMTSIIGDICDLEYLSKVLNEYQPEIIFHLAAQPLVRESYIDPKTTYETNVIGTLNVYEASRKCQSVKAIVCITTDKCYENKEWVYGYREGDRLGGYDPYSSSKACVEILTASYKRSFFNPSGIQVATVRAGNVIGGGDWAKDRLVPDAIRSLMNNENILIRNASATRPWQHILEPLSGYLWLGFKLLSEVNKYNSSWNFGPHDEANQTVELVIKDIICYLESGHYTIEAGNHPHEAKLLKLDISKAKSDLNWHPVYGYQIALENTIYWYEEYYRNNSEMYDVTLKQIKQYVNEARRLNLEWSGGVIDD